MASPSTSRAHHETLGWIYFAGAGLLAFFALVVDTVAVQRGVHQGLLTVTVATAAAAVGFVSYLGIVASRGILSVGWPGLLFPVAFSLFHFGSLGMVEQGWYREELFGTAWSLSAVCLLAWMFGYLVARGRERVEVGALARHGWVLLSPRELDRIAYLGTLGTALGVAMNFGAFVVVGFWDIMRADYMGSLTLLSPEYGGRPAYVFAIGKLLVAVSVTVTAAAGALGRRRVLHNRIFAVLAIVHLLVLLHLGDRSEFSIVVFPMALFHHAYVRPFRWKHVFVLGPLLFGLFAVVKATRATTNFEDFLFVASEVVSFEHLFDEMGYTLDTVIRSLVVVPVDTPYFLGKTYLHAVARALPNITMTPRTWGFVSSRWINWETAPELALRGNALGYSIVAEAYINFGFVGAPIVHAVIGAIHGRLERVMTGRVVSVWSVMAFSLVTVALMMHVRNTVVLYIRLAIWLLTMLGGFWVAYVTSRLVRTDLRRS